MSGKVGFIGLGNMGFELATNLVKSGRDVIAYDLAGSGRNPPGAEFADDLEAIGRTARVVVLSLPDGTASESVTRALRDTRGRATTHVIDTGTIGIDASKRIDRLLKSARLGYIDAAVSGGAAGARARSLAVIYAGSASDCEAVGPVLAGLSDRLFKVGAEPGMAQAVKLANNFLSATALAATSEAVAFATTAGVDMATFLDVLNASSGQSAASSDKFVNHVLTERYSSGFHNTLMAKDLQLYMSAARRQGTPSMMSYVTSRVWNRFADATPEVDFTRIYPFVNSRYGSRRSGSRAKPDG